MDNKTIADIFNEIADMVSIDETPTSKFEVNAYRKAALTISTTQEPIEDVYKKGGIKALMSLSGIGKGLATKIEEFINTGKIAKYEELKKRYPIDFAALTRIQGVGAKKAVALYKALGVKDLKDLKSALQHHQIRDLEGFGEKSEQLINKGIEVLASGAGRMLLGDALPVAEAIVKRLMQSGTVTSAVVAGSARRMRETVGDLDILALANKSESAIAYFTTMDSVADVVVKGPTKATVRLKFGLNCDLRVIKPESFGAALQYFTGSKEHNVQVRQIAINKSLKLNEYGLFNNKGRPVAALTEEEVYAKLGMEYIQPEIREARGEVKLAQAHKLPILVELSDIKGDMHTHTKETDGVNTVEEMAVAASNQGLSYFATTNHTKSLKVARGMNEVQFKKYFSKVDALNKKLDGKLTILKGAEVDILKDGTLDLDKQCLKTMDCVVGAVHSAFKLPESEMTARVVKALDSGLVNILAHPTGRIVNSRVAFSINLDKVCEAAERNNAALEINAFPERLDLNDTNILLASKYKLNFSIDTDSHNISHFGFMRYGVGTARRGWLTKEKIINTRDLKSIMKILAK